MDTFFSIITVYAMEITKINKETEIAKSLKYTVCIMSQSYETKQEKHNV